MASGYDPYARTTFFPESNKNGDVLPWNHTLPINEELQEWIPVAQKACGYKDVILNYEGQLDEETEEMIFKQLPKLAAACCEHVGMAGEERACAEAVNVLFRWYRGQIDRLDFIDEELLKTLLNLQKYAQAQKSQVHLKFWRCYLQKQS